MRTFDPESANRLVPVLAEVFGRLRPVVEEVQVLDRKQQGGDTEAAVRREALVAQLEAEISALEQLGIEVKSADGLVDFRAVRAGRPVYLCWRFGEDRITHWHPIDSGFAGRKPLGAVDLFEPTYLS